MCWLILRLDRIPRYGRIYRYDTDTKESSMHWRYQKRGLWGFNFLDNIEWLHEYVDETIDWNELPVWYPTQNYTEYKIYSSANWREDLRWRRRMGIWPKPTKHYVRVSYRRYVDEASLDRTGG